jgi:hypothetical protein
MTIDQKSARNIEANRGRDRSWRRFLKHEEVLGAMRALKPVI